MQFICYYVEINLTSYNEFQFASLSYQWICIILGVGFFLLTCLDNFKILIIIG